MFKNYGVIHIEKNQIDFDGLFEIVTNLGVIDCLKLKDRYEIITEKEDFYKIKSELERKINNFVYSSIEWRAVNNLTLNKDQNDKMKEILNALEELDDVQKVFTNVNLGN